MGEWGRARLRALVTVVLLGTVGLVATLVALTAAGGDRREPVPADSVPADSVPADAAAAGRRYAVSPAGTDDADGSTTRPWRTLGHALERLRPGDTLVVGAGTYEEDLDPDLTSGRPDARITVTGEDGAWPVVKGLVRLRDPDYWTVRGLELTWGGGGFDDHMVKVVSGTGWVLERLRIHGSRSRAGLLIAGSTEDGPPRDYTLRDSVVWDSRRASNVYLNPGLGSSGGLVENNLFFGSPTENIKIGFGGGCDDQDNPLFGAAGVVVRGNTMYDAEQPVTVAEPAERVTVTGNLVGGGRRGFLIRVDGECGNLGDGIEVRDNLGWAADRWCEDFDSPVTCQDVDAGGNVFPRDPRLDSTRLGGFVPRDPVAARYGYRPAGASS